MVGRSAEVAVLTQALSAVGESGAALVIDGEAGIGKSTLLSAAVDWATRNGYTQLRCSGLQTQTEVGFAGVHELIHPLLSHTDALPARQRRALMTAFGLEDGPAPDRLLVSLAILGLFEEAATKRRVVLVVDDVQWLDPSSLDVLAFVARRLTNAPLMMLCAERTDLDGPVPQLDGLPRLSLGPLAPADAAELLIQTLRNGAHTADNHLHQRILEQANGNPLAVIELAGAIGERGSETTIFAGEPLPTSRRVERAFLAQLDNLTLHSRTLLLLISAGDGSLPEISFAATALGLDFGEHLAPLERTSLVTVGGGRIQVRHPLIRSTVYGAATLSARAQVHRALADASTDTTRAAWHRAEAAYGPDADVAADLEHAAQHARARGAGAESVAALRRAGALSPDRTDRIRRLAAAAEVARSSGLTAEAISILSEAEQLAAQPADAEPLAITRFVLNVTAAIPGQSAGDLVRLAGKFSDGEAAQRELLWAAAIECRMHGLLEHPRRDVAAAIRLLDDVDGDVMTATAMALVEDTGAGLRLRERLPQLIAEVSDAPLLLMALAFAAEAVSDRQHALQCWTLVANRSRRRGTPADECEGLRGTAQLLIQEGRVQSAAIAAQNALRMAEDMNLPMTQASAAALLARALTWQGQCDRAREALARARGVLAADPSILWNDDAHWAAGLAALYADNHAGALQHLVKMAGHRTSCRWAIADLAEAAAGCGHAERIRPRVTDISRQAELLGVGLDQMLVHRAYAVLATDDDEIERHFRTALEAGENASAELELARTQLLYGKWLRRQRRIVEARTQLAVALTAFETAGATPMTMRAAAELRAAGVTAARPGLRNQPADSLTPQELQIAQMAASGLTNREIADRIYVSHKTVAAHLYKVFPKLGITSRSQLHSTLGDGAT